MQTSEYRTTVLRTSATASGKPRILRLLPGDEVLLSSGGQTDEGFSFTEHRFANDGRAITMEINTSASDCDGRLKTYSRMECDALDVRAGYMEIWPAWRLVDSSQRDFAAEAMGY